MNQWVKSGMVLAASLLAGCVIQQKIGETVRTREVLPEERARMQTRVYPATEEAVFGATVSVLQELGWTLDSADRASGIIRSSNEKRLEPLGPKEENITNYEWRRKTIKKRASEKDQWTRWDEMVIHIEKWPGAKCRQRIVLSRNGSLPAMSYPSRVDKRDVVINAPAKEESVEIQLEEVYDTLFRQIEKAVQARVAGLPE